MWLKDSHIHQVFQFLILITFITVSGCASVPSPKNVFTNPPQAPMPLNEKDLLPGLSVLYFYQYFDSIFWMPKGKLAKQIGKPGPPIPNLDYWSEKDGEVFDSKRKEAVGMEITGFIRLEQPGLHLFQTNSNDGIRIYIDNQLIIDEPEVQPDHLSIEAPFEVTEPGWYWIGIQYFQKRYSARLQFYWKTPGADRFEIVPPQALAHKD